MEDDGGNGDGKIPLDDIVKPTTRQRAVRLACLFFNVLCGVTNGYDICVTSVVLDVIVRNLSLCADSAESDPGTETFERPSELGALEQNSCSRKQAVMSISALGAFCAKFGLTWLADRFGRRFALVIVDVLIIVSVVAQVATSSATVFFFGRFVLGMAMGLAFIVGPTYICEIAPPDQRGLYVVVNEVAVCAGCLVGLQVATSLLADWHPDVQAWRVAVALGALPAVLQLAFVFFLPESPRWLAMHGHCTGLESAALALGLTATELEGLRNTAKKSTVLHDSNVWQEQRHKCRFSSSALRRFLKAQQVAYGKHGLAFLLSLCVAFFTTASGIFAMQSYAYDILIVSGFSNPRNLLPLIGWMKLGGALVAMVLADTSCAGRRRLALCGGLVCCACHTTLAVHLSSPGFLPEGFVAASFFCFIFFWNAGYGGIQFAATLEMLPNEVRSLWGGQIFAIVGIVEILIYQLFELLLFQDGVATFALFGAINFGSFIFAAFVMPDLGGQSLETGSEGLSPTEPAAPAAPDISASPAAHTGKTKKTVVNRKVRKYGKLVEAPSEAPSEANSGRVDTEAIEPEPVVIGLSDGI